MRYLDDGTVLVQITDASGTLYSLVLKPEQAKALSEELAQKKPEPDEPPPPADDDEEHLSHDELDELERP